MVAQTTSSPANTLLATFATDDLARSRVRSVVSEHYDFVWRSLRRLGVAEANADDEAQQVFCVFAQRVASVTIGKEKSFLFGTVMRVAQAARRRHARSSKHEVIVEYSENNFEPANGQKNAEELLDAERARAVLDQLLDQMPIALRAVFVLYEIEELTMAEIAQVLDLPPGTVASRLRRARELFEKLSREVASR